MGDSERGVHIRSTLTALAAMEGLTGHTREGWSRACDALNRGLTRMTERCSQLKCPCFDGRRLRQGAGARGPILKPELAPDPVAPRPRCNHRWHRSLSCGWCASLGALPHSQGRTSSIQPKILDGGKSRQPVRAPSSLQISLANRDSKTDAHSGNPRHAAGRHVQGTGIRANCGPAGQAHRRCRAGKPQPAGRSCAGE